MSQVPIEFPDPEEGKRRRDEAIELVGENAGEAWRLMAVGAALEVVAEGHDFTSERIRQKLTEWGEWPPPNDPRALGAIMRLLRKEGYIEPTDTYIHSVYASSHRMPKRVWRVVGR